MLFGSLLGALIVIAWIVALIHIVRRRHTRTLAATTAWILVVLILPVVGTIAYFLVNALTAELEGDSPGAGVSPQPDASPFGDDLRAGATRDPDGTRFGR
ncbi:MAG TPA: PLD nuclease N-terminal domain-containing protein [Gaiellaceae bacterium]|nr:PLD nuclease N-terminal domain-containing protein [Gaiellaceae bacterium]